MTITTIKKNISEESMVDAFLQSGHFKTAKLYKEMIHKKRTDTFVSVFYPDYFPVLPNPPSRMP